MSERGRQCSRCGRVRPCHWYGYQRAQCRLCIAERRRLRYAVQRAIDARRREEER